MNCCRCGKTWWLVNNVSKYALCAKCLEKIVDEWAELAAEEAAQTETLRKAALSRGEP